jgi:hypothetical protein
MTATRHNDTRILILTAVRPSGILAINLALPLGLPDAIVVPASLQAPLPRDIHLAAAPRPKQTALGYFLSATGGAVSPMNGGTEHP